MPELPEVETIVQGLIQAGIVGQTIDKAIVYWHRSIAAPDVTLFPEKIAKQQIVSIHRRAKFLVFTLSQDILLVHLRMTGKFLLEKNSKISIHKHERIRLYFSDGRVLRFEDQRKFARWYLISDAAQVLQKLGVEPLTKEFTQELLKALLKKSSVSIKAFLLNQKYIAGLGNIYVDEALWLAQIHPLQKANSIDFVEISALHSAIIHVLKKGIENTGTSLGKQRANYMSINGKQGQNQNTLNIFRKDGLPCPRCKTIIAKMVVAQRGTHVCPFCQKLH